MPAILHAQQNADRIKCLARLFQIGAAVQLHRTEHHDYLPAAGWHFDPNKNDPAAAGGASGSSGASSSPQNIATPVGLHDSAESRYMYYLDNGTKRPLPITAALGHYMYADVRTDSRESLIADLNGDRLTRLFLCPALARKQMLSGLAQRDDKDNWTAPPSSLAIRLSGIQCTHPRHLFVRKGQG